MEWPFILLAAGASSRMGRPKGLLEYRGGTWLEAQVKTLRTQGLERVIVVLGRDARLYEGVLARISNVESRFNPDPEGGPFSSLQAGLDGIAGPAWICPLDVPITTELAALAGVLKGAAEAVVPSFLGRGGHPVLLSMTLIQRLKRVQGASEEARLDLQLRSANTIRVPVADPRVVLNLNTPQAWRAFIQP